MFLQVVDDFIEGLHVVENMDEISKKTADALTMHESVDFRSTGGFGRANLPNTSRKNLHNRTFITTISKNEDKKHLFEQRH